MKRQRFETISELTEELGRKVPAENIVCLRDVGGRKYAFTESAVYVLKPLNLLDRFRLWLDRRRGARSIVDAGPWSETR